MSSWAKSIRLKSHLWAGAGGEEPRALQKERELAGVRVVLASYVLIAIHYDPARSHADLSALSLVVSLYLLYGFLVLISTSFFGIPTKGGTLCIHVLDVIWPQVMYLLTPAPHCWQIVLLVIFGPIAAGWRWGAREAVTTGVAESLLLFVGQVTSALALSKSFHMFGRGYIPEKMLPEDISLIPLAVVLGYWFAIRKRLEAQASIANRLLWRANLGHSFRDTFEEALCAIGSLFDSKSVVVAVREIESGQAFLWESTGKSDQFTITLSKLGQDGEDTYFFSTGAKSWYFRAPQHGRGGRLLAVGTNRKGAQKGIFSVPDSLGAAKTFREVFAVDFSVRDAWSGRIYLFDPQVNIAIASQLRFLQSIVMHVSSILYGVYHLRHVRARARAAERAHIARELHDGLIQSLAAIELRLEIVRRQATKGSTSNLADQIEGVEEILRQEITCARELMQRFRCEGMCSRQLLSCLSDLVDTFQSETGISARFVSEVNDVAVRPRVCREVALIVLEALTNVRKHSAARSVLVRFGTDKDSYRLSIRDDGRGFNFPEESRQSQLDAQCQAPKVLKERVEVIGGELAIESAPSKGATLKVRFPREAYPTFPI